jgi:hypothetical protein
MKAGAHPPLQELRTEAIQICRLDCAAARRMHRSVNPLSAGTLPWTGHSPCWAVDTGMGVPSSLCRDVPLP